MAKLIMMKGLPASGKSTEALRLVKEEGFKRVSKDDLRSMTNASKWSKHNELVVRDIETRIAGLYINLGCDVVVDDTNFAWEDYWRNNAEGMGAEFEVRFFDVPLQECIKRDSLRGDKSVGQEVIYKMYERYIKPTIKKPLYDISLPDAFIFDLDGTLAQMGDRSPYDWEKVGIDGLNENVAHVLDALKASRKKILIVSGRDSICAEQTITWLDDNNIEYDALFMRARCDSRKDTIVKEEIYNNKINGKYNVLGIFDDRSCVVDMWRSLGLTVFQCDYGHF